MPIAKVAFPESIDAIPRDVARYIQHRIVARNVAIHPTPPELFNWLFRGTMLAGREVYYGMAPRDIWVLILEEAERWNQTHPNEPDAEIGE